MTAMRLGETVILANLPASKIEHLYEVLNSQMHFEAVSGESIGYDATIFVFFFGIERKENSFKLLPLLPVEKCFGISELVGICLGMVSQNRDEARAVSSNFFIYCFTLSEGIR